MNVKCGGLRRDIKYLDVSMIEKGVLFRARSKTVFYVMQKDPLENDSSGCRC